MQSRWLMVPAALMARPRLLGSMLVGLAVGVVLFIAPNPLKETTRLIVAWDVGCLAFAAATVHLMRGCPVEAMRQLAAQQDEGQGAILSLTLLATAASVVAITAELSQAKGGHGLVANSRIALAFATVVLSWFLVQTIFALHYAHEFYAPQEGEPGEIRRGLGFPGDEQPDYWDFLHFSIVIGVAAQTADIGFTSKTLRRIGTVHSLVAFVFNTLVLALTINLAAGLF